MGKHHDNYRKNDKQPASEIASTTVDFKQNLLKIFIFILLLFFYGSFLIHKIELPMADDLARHIKNGEMILGGHKEILYANVYSYTETNYPFVNHHWLSGIIFYLLDQIGGWNILVIFKTLLFLLTFTILFITAKRKANFWLVAFFSIPTILIFGQRTTLRPEIFSYFFTAIFLYFLTDLETHPKRNIIFWIVPIQLLWVNLHIFFPIGIILVSGFFFEKIIIHYKNFKENILIKKLSILFTLLILVCFINPNGLKGALQPFNIFTNYGMSVDENLSVFQFFQQQPLWEHIPILIFILAIIPLLISFIFGFEKKPFFYFLGAICTSIAGFFMIRNTIFFGFMFLPAISQNLNHNFEMTKKWMQKISSYANNITIILFILVILILTIFGTKKIMPFNKFGIGLAPHTEDAALFIKEKNLRGPIFNNFDSGSYLIYFIFPKEKVFIDNRSEAYPSTFIKNNYLSVLQDDVVWKKILQQYNFNLIFLYRYDQAYVYYFTYTRTQDPAWSLIFADTYHMIFFKNIPENKAIIEQFGITPQNVEKKLDYLVKSENFDDQVAAADTFTLVGRTDLGISLFSKIITTWPEKGKIWMTIGKLKLLSDTPHDTLSALTHLEKAISLNYDTADTYYFLGLAYTRMNEPKKAEQALLNALQKDPNHQATKTLLSRISQK